MLRGDIVRSICDKMGINPNQVSDREGLLAGQTIKRNGIENFSSYKLMNSDERKCVDDILTELTHPDVDVKTEKGKALLKQKDSLVPSSYSSDTLQYKDVT